MNTGVKTACLVASVLLGASTYAAEQTIYDNTANLIGAPNVTPESNAEIGDYVNFAGTARTLQSFGFDYYVTPGAAVTFQAFIYANDRATPSGNMPGTLLYSSGAAIPLSGAANGYGSLTINGLNFTVPDSVTWTVKFNGATAGQSAGLLFANPPTVGVSPTGTLTGGQITSIDSGSVPGHQDFTVLNAGTGFQLVNHNSQAGGTLIDNLDVRFTAVPEPATWAIFAGGLALIAFRRRKA